MDERTLLEILASRPPGQPAYRMRLDPTRSGARVRMAVTRRSATTGRSLLAGMLSLALIIALGVGAAFLAGVAPHRPPIGGSPSAPASASPVPIGFQRPLPEGRYAVSAGHGSPTPFHLGFDIPEGTVGAWATLKIPRPALLELGRPDGPLIQVWWRVEAVTDDLCNRDGAEDWVFDPQFPDPGPTETYDVIRALPELDASPEAPFRFAGATGRSVDLTVRPEARARCERDAGLLADGGLRGSLPQGMGLPQDGALRLATVEVAGHEFLIAVHGSSPAELRRADAILDTFVVTPTTRAAASPEPPLSGRFDIGGRSLYVTCVGSGGPTVVLDAGVGDDASTWDPVIEEIAATGRVCAYDRANTGRSDAAPTPRSLADAVGDLHALLQSAGVRPPYVLVGHGLGGLDARLFAANYPAEVDGIVLVDATPVELVDVDMACARLTAAACEALRSGDGPNAEGLVPSAADLERLQRFGSPYLPARVLVATDHGGEGATGAEIESLAGELQAELEASWYRAGLVVAEGSGPRIQDEHPELLVQAVEDVVRAARFLRGF